MTLPENVKNKIYSKKICSYREYIRAQRYSLFYKSQHKNAFFIVKQRILTA